MAVERSVTERRCCLNATSVPRLAQRIARVLGANGVKFGKRWRRRVLLRRCDQLFGTCGTEKRRCECRAAELEVEWNKSKKVVTTYESWDTIIQRLGHVVVSKMAPDVRAWDDGSNKVWLIVDRVWSHAAHTPERESCCTECSWEYETRNYNKKLYQTSSSGTKTSISAALVAWAIGAQQRRMEESEAPVQAHADDPCACWASPEDPTVEEPRPIVARVSSEKAW